jgi:hypothetical protein
MTRNADRPTRSQITTADGDVVTLADVVEGRTMGDEPLADPWTAHLIPDPFDARG